MLYKNENNNHRTYLISKYNVPGPRYTSYPTVPYWYNMPMDEMWTECVRRTFEATNGKEGISLYIHLPFCRSLCTYCGCNTRITANHAVEEPYINTLLKEWQLYLDIFDKKPIISEIHLGGGTPTFFSAQNLERLLGGIMQHATLSEDAVLGFEGHPKNTTETHLQTLYDIGFRRLSLGIQDFDPNVQMIINRIQPYEMVEEVTQNARKIGYTSINYDLIFGLPLQNLATMDDTISKVHQLQPDRIAFYSYAHVPWIKPGQRSFSKADLPTDAEKRVLYELGKQRFEDMGYHEIGMDHFALPNDDLYQAAINKTMHRNFMGYTPKHTQLMIGLGASSISDTGNCFVQNVKKVEEYTTIVDQGKFPFFRGHQLTTQDNLLRKHITALMCQLETSWTKKDIDNPVINKGLHKLSEMEKDGLVINSSDKLIITEKGRPFVRNVCMCFDEYLWQSKPQTQIFSQTI